jgi:hypothetical protein
LPWWASIKKIFCGIINSSFKILGNIIVPPADNEGVPGCYSTNNLYRDRFEVFVYLGILKFFS